MNGRLFCQRSNVLTFTPRLGFVVTAATTVPFVVTGALVFELFVVPLAEPHAARRQRSGAAENALTERIDFLSDPDAELFGAVWTAFNLLAILSFTLSDFGLIAIAPPPGTNERGA